VESFLARQGIVDPGPSLRGREIFHRDGVEIIFAAKEGDRATAPATRSSLPTFGMGEDWPAEPAVTAFVRPLSEGVKATSRGRRRGRAAFSSPPWPARKAIGTGARVS
jgi:hypothetical protein